MTKLSSNTKLMNVVIALTQKNSKFPSTLYNIGYQLENIEPHFSDSQGHLINPDLQIKSHEDKNLLFIECKSGGVEHEQALNFKNVQKTDIINSNITSLDMSDSNFEFAFLCNDSNKEKVIQADDLQNYGFTILCCNESSISNERDKLICQKLKTIFPINIPSYAPTEFYPFGPDDNDEYISLSIFQSLMHLMGEDEITVEKILKDSHKYYDYINTKGKEKLKAKVGKIMNDLEQNQLKDALKKLKNPERYKIHSKSYKGFRDLCQKMVEGYQKKIPQMGLVDYF